MAPFFIPAGSILESGEAGRQSEEDAQDESESENTGVFYYYRVYMIGTSRVVSDLACWLPYLFALMPY